MTLSSNHITKLNQSRIWLIVLGILFQLDSYAQPIVSIQTNQFIITPGADFTTVGDIEILQDIRVEGNLIIQGDGVNNAMVLNTGSVSVTGNWTNNGVYNGIGGTFIVDGTNIQLIDNAGQDFDTLVVDGGGEKQFVTEVDITGYLDLINGKVVMLNADTLTIKDMANVSDGNVDSYVMGILFEEGTGRKHFPIGKATFAPVTLEDVIGAGPLTLAFEVMEPNNNPMPENELIGVSTKRNWELTVVVGNFDSSIVTLGTQDEDLGQLGPTNQINVLEDEPVVAQLDTAGVFVSLGNANASLISDPSITSLIAGTGRIYALALAPKVPEAGVLFVPNVFAPGSMNPNDQTFRVLGEFISTENFALRIFDKWGLIVYETEDFNEANTIGWNGKVNNTGADLNMGSYSYSLSGTFENTGASFNQVGSVVLMR